MFCQFQVGSIDYVTVEKFCLFSSVCSAVLCSFRGVQVLSLRVNCERYVCNPYRYGSHSTQVISSVSFLTEAPLDTLGTRYQPRPVRNSYTQHALYPVRPRGTHRRLSFLLKTSEKIARTGLSRSCLQRSLSSKQ